MTEQQIADQILEAAEDELVRFKVLDDMKSNHVILSYWKLYVDGESGKQRYQFEYHCTWMIPKSTYEVYLKNKLPLER